MYNPLLHLFSITCFFAFRPSSSAWNCLAPASCPPTPGPAKASFTTPRYWNPSLILLFLGFFDYDCSILWFLLSQYWHQSLLLFAMNMLVVIGFLDNYVFPIIWILVLCIEYFLQFFFSLYRPYRWCRLSLEFRHSSFPLISLLAIFQL